MERENETVVDWESAQRRVRAFVEERDWDQFHNIKDLAIGLGAEAGELLEQVLWKSPEDLAIHMREDHPSREAMLDEVSDILFYLIRLFDKLDANPWESLENKLAKNESKYPAELSRGRSEKYTAYLSGKPSVTGETSEK